MLGEGMKLGRSEIDGHFDGSVEPFEDEHQRDGKDEHGPFNPADAQPETERASDDADEQFDAGISLRAQQVADSDERKIEGPRHLCRPRSARGFQALGKHLSLRLSMHGRCLQAGGRIRRESENPQAF